MRRYERASTLLTSNRPVDDWGKLLGDTAAVTALLDRLWSSRNFVEPLILRMDAQSQYPSDGAKCPAAAVWCHGS